jgi:hypothetical protein
MLTPCFLILFPLPKAVIMLISTALLLDSNIRNSVCTPACRAAGWSRVCIICFTLHFVVGTFHSTFFGEDDPFCCTLLTQFLTK